ncbi:MAG: PilN domain-containing protein [Planctomycetota bacterium]|nr:PilN domain-containing protein [Planctomycetota bacterium]
MQVMNFLPRDFTERRGRRRANLLCLGLAGVALLALAGVCALYVIRVFGASSLRAVVEQQYRKAGRQIEQLKKLEDRKAGLVRKVELSADLLERVPRSHILARLTNALPSDTSLQVLVMSSVEVEVPAPKPTTTKDGEASTAASKGSKLKRPEKIRRREIQFRLDGLAVTDVQVAEYIARLAADPLFEEVNLKFSEEFPYEPGVTMRRFELTFRLSLEAQKLLASGDEAKAALPTAASPPRSKS